MVIFRKYKYSACKKEIAICCKCAECEWRILGSSIPSIIAFIGRDRESRPRNFTGPVPIFTAIRIFVKISRQQPILGLQFFLIKIPFILFLYKFKKRLFCAWPLLVTKDADNWLNDNSEMNRNYSCRFLPIKVIYFTLTCASNLCTKVPNIYHLLISPRWESRQRVHRAEWRTTF